MFLTFSLENARQKKSGPTRKSKSKGDEPAGRDPHADNEQTRKLPIWQAGMHLQVHAPHDRSSEGDLNTWTLQQRPPTQLARGFLVTLHSTDTIVRSGRLSRIAKTTKHWVLFRITGVPRNDGLWVPIPWARLSKLESYRHTTQFQKLSDTPRPHEDFLERFNALKREDNPYEFDIDKRDRQELETRLRNQTR